MNDDDRCFYDPLRAPGTDGECEHPAFRVVARYNVCRKCDAWVPIRRNWTGELTAACFLLLALLVIMAAVVRR